MRLGIIATTRAGAPLPPASFMGITINVEPALGTKSILPLRFSMPYMPAPSRMRWAMKSVLLPVSKEAVDNVRDYIHSSSLYASYKFKIKR